jgi:hypothetical protein
LNLYNAQGNELGDVERVVEGPDGKQYLVIGAGGFLGIGEKPVPIPLERVAVRGDRLVDQIRAMQTVDLAGSANSTAMSRFRSTPFVR